MTPQQADSALGLEAGSTARKIAARAPGDTMVIGRRRFLIKGNSELEEITRADASTSGDTDEALAKVLHLAERAEHDLGQRYKVLSSDDGVATLLEVAEPGVVRAVRREALLTALAQRYAGELLPSKIKNELLPAVLARFGTGALRAEDIRPLRFASDTTPDFAWMRLPFDPDPDAACPPEFESIVSRGKDGRDSAVLFIGSLLDYESSRAQYLHLSGQGNDGKSTLTDMLAAVFEKSTVTFNADDFRDTHATEKFEGARLVIFHDEEDNRFMSSGKFKALTGDRTLTINPKGQPRRTIRLNCKVIITSNPRPELRGSAADMRRIIPVYLESHKGGEDGGFVKRLMAARYQVMQYCYAQWVRHREAGGASIPAGKHATEDIGNHSIAAAAEEAFGRWFVDDATGSISWSDIEALLKNEAPYVAKQVKTYIRNSDRYALTRPGTGGSRPRVYSGFRTKLGASVDEKATSV